MKRALALCLLATACGKTLPLLPDGAGGGDGGGIDALALSDASQLITVTVLSTDQAATPVASIPVILLDATGTLIASGTTDDHGQFTHAASAGASVTIVRTINNNTGGADLTTIAGANPGDALVFGAPAGSVVNSGAMTIVYPTIFDAEFYEADDGCSSASATSGNTITLQHYSECAAASELILTSVTSTNISNHYIDVPHQMFTDGNEIDLSTSQWTDTPTKTFAYANLPTNLSTLLHIDGSVAIMSNGRASYRIDDSATVSGTTASTTTFLPPVGTALEVQSQIARSDSENWGAQQIIEMTTPDAQYSLDVSAALSSWIDSSSVTFDPSIRTVGWTTGASDGAQAQNSAKAMAIDAYYSRVDGNYHWRVYAAAASSLTLPALPSAFATYAPNANDSVSDQVLYIGTNAGASYDSIRNHIDFLNYDTEAFIANTPSVTRVTIDGLPLL